MLIEEEMKRREFVSRKRGVVSKRAHRAADKWEKTQLFLSDAKIKKHLPATRLLTKYSLKEMLQQWGMVYVKPTRGSQGRGVMKVERREEKGAGRVAWKYHYQLGEQRRSFGSYEAFYPSILKDTKGKDYLVQKGIGLLKHEGRPFDIRVVIQRTPRGGWEATGTLARVAHPRKIVTNGSQGGTIYPTAYLLGKYTNSAKRKSMLAYMDQLGIHTARRMERSYSGINELGLDIAIDHKLKPWILEVNTIPDPCPFTLLKDQTMLRKIVRYAKGYGRTYTLNCNKANRGKM